MRDVTIQAQGLPPSQVREVASALIGLASSVDRKAWQPLLRRGAADALGGVVEPLGLGVAATLTVCDIALLAKEVYDLYRRSTANAEDSRAATSRLEQACERAVNAIALVNAAADLQHFWSMLRTADYVPRAGYAPAAVAALLIVVEALQLRAAHLMAAEARAAAAERATAARASSVDAPDLFELTQSLEQRRATLLQQSAAPAGELTAICLPRRAASLRSTRSQRRARADLPNLLPVSPSFMEGRRDGEQ